MHYPYKIELQLGEAVAKAVAARVKNILSETRLDSDSKDDKDEWKDLRPAVNKLAADLFFDNQRNYMAAFKPYLPPMIFTISDENAALLRNWADEFLSHLPDIEKSVRMQIADELSGGYGKGLTPKQLVKDLSGRAFSLGKNRSMLIARTEIGKLNQKITSNEFKRIGVKLYKWQSSIDERVRPSHKAMNGRICKVDDPTVYLEGGEKNLAEGDWIDRGEGVKLHPGEDFQCRCIMLPVEAEMKSFDIDDDDGDTQDSDFAAMQSTEPPANYADRNKAIGNIEKKLAPKVKKEYKKDSYENLMNLCVKDKTNMNLFTEMNNMVWRIEYIPKGAYAQGQNVKYRLECAQKNKNRTTIHEFHHAFWRSMDRQEKERLSGAFAKDVERFFKEHNIEAKFGSAMSNFKKLDEILQSKILPALEKDYPKLREEIRRGLGKDWLNEAKKRFEDLDNSEKSKQKWVDYLTDREKKSLGGDLADGFYGLFLSNAYKGRRPSKDTVRNYEKIRFFFSHDLRYWLSIMQYTSVNEFASGFASVFFNRKKEKNLFSLFGEIVPNFKKELYGVWESKIKAEVAE